MKGEVDRLTSLSFVGFQQVVETALSFKARNAADPLGFPNYAKVLYSWHVWRGDYRSGKVSSLSNLHDPILMLEIQLAKPCFNRHDGSARFTAAPNSISTMQLSRLVVTWLL